MERSLFSEKIVSLAAILSVCAVTHAEFADRSNLVLHYAMDGLGSCPSVPDLSGNGHDAFSANNVVGGKITNAKCLTGFTSTTSYVCATNVVSDWNANWSFVTWVRNPNMNGTKPHVIARGAGRDDAAYYDGSGGDNAWQVWIAADGRIGIGIQNWVGSQTNNVSYGEETSPVLTWKPDVWYQVAALCEFSFKNDVRYKKIKVYVTEEGSSALGEPVAQLEQNTAAGFGGKVYNLVIGAARNGYYGTSHPEGYFDGEICEATLFARTLTTADLLSDVMTFTRRYHATEDFAKLYWKLDETGATPTAVDATGNGFAGTTIGNVSGGYAAPTGICYGGFAAQGDVLYGTLDNGQYFQNGARNDVVLWVKRPLATSSSTALLAGNMTMITDPGSSQPWRVFVTEKGAVGVSMQSWNGNVSKTVGEPYAWGKGWHLICIRFDLPTLQVVSSTQENPDGSVTTNYTSTVCPRIRVYGAPAAKAGEECELALLVQGAILKKNSLLESASNVVFGSAGGGYYKEFQPKSALGAGGRIGEVAVSIGGWFDFDYLKSRLSRYWQDPPGLSVILR